MNCSPLNSNYLATFTGGWCVWSQFLVLPQHCTGSMTISVFSMRFHFHLHSNTILIIIILMVDIHIDGSLQFLFLAASCYLPIWFDLHTSYQSDTSSENPRCIDYSLVDNRGHLDLTQPVCAFPTVHICLSLIESTVVQLGKKISRNTCQRHHTPDRSCKMSNLLQGPISSNQILPREKCVNRDIFSPSNLQNRTYEVSCDEWMCI